MDDHTKQFREWGALDGQQEIVSPETVLPEDDLVYFLLETIPHFDLTAFYEYYSTDGRGQPPFNLIDSSRWNADVLCQAVLANPQGSEKLIQKNLAGVDGGWFSSRHHCASMVINNLNLVGIAGIPAKTHTPLIVNPNTVLAFSISAEFLKSIAERNTQVSGRFRGIEKQEFP